MLVFPAEPADARFSSRFHDRHIDHQPTHPAVRNLALVACQVGQSLIRYGLYKTVAQDTQGNAGRAYCFAVRRAFLNLGIGIRGAVRIEDYGR